MTVATRLIYSQIFLTYQGLTGGQPIYLRNTLWSSRKEPIRFSDWGQLYTSTGSNFGMTFIQRLNNVVCPVGKTFPLNYLEFGGNSHISRPPITWSPCHIEREKQGYIYLKKYRISEIRTRDASMTCDTVRRSTNAPRPPPLWTSRLVILV